MPLSRQFNPRLWHRYPQTLYPEIIAACKNFTDGESAACQQVLNKMNNDIGAFGPFNLPRS